MKYVYPAVFSAEPVGIGVIFPDLDGCVSQADNFLDAYKRAHEALALHLWGMKEDGETFPKPRKPEDVPLADNEILVMVVVSSENFSDAN